MFNKHEMQKWLGQVEEICEAGKKIVEKYKEEKEESKEKLYDPTWRAEEWKIYWYIENSTVSFTTERNNIRDENRWLSGNYFKTKEQAEKKLEYDKALIKIKRYIWENFGHFEPDWNSDDYSRYKIYYNHYVNELKYDDSCFHQYISSIPYLRTSTQCDKLIKDMEPELKIVLFYNQ